MFRVIQRFSLIQAKIGLLVNKNRIIHILLGKGTSNNEESLARIRVMLEPDFGESQFQQLFNDGLIRRLQIFGLQPIIPTLRQERDLGWDTGLNIPGLQVPDPSQKNCNLFLQYKLSKEIKGRSGGQWHHWQQPYFKFEIVKWKNAGHPGGNYPDFHQYRALKQLADNGYLTFYVPNNTLDLEELLDWANNNTIVDNNPVLDIRKITHEHLVVTFLKDSDYYFLDSNPEKTSKTALHTFAKEVLMASKRTSITEDVKLLPGLLSEYETFSKVYKLRVSEVKPKRIEGEWFILYQTISQVLGLVWLKLHANN